MKFNVHKEEHKNVVCTDLTNSGHSVPETMYVPFITPESFLCNQVLCLAQELTALPTFLINISLSFKSKFMNGITLKF